MPPNDSPPVVLTRVPSEMIASILVAGLQNEGIRAQFVGGLTSGFRAEAPGLVQILILGPDHPRARDLLAQWNLPTP